MVQLDAEDLSCDRTTPVSSTLVDGRNVGIAFLCAGRRNIGEIVLELAAAESAAPSKVVEMVNV